MPFVTAIDGTQLYWREWGQGTPILFLGGLGCDGRMWDYQLAALAEHDLRCITLDRRGHGRSDQPAAGYDYDTLADDVAKLADHLGLEGLTLVGHSMACGEVIRFLTRHGIGRVSRIILIGCTTPMLLKTDDNAGGIPKAAFDALWAEWRRDYPKWVADNVAPFFVPETSPALMRWGENLLQASLPATLACSRAMAETDFRAEMKQIEVPVLLIHGDRDRSMPLEITGRPSAELIPHSQLVIYEGAPHGLMYTHMDRLHADMLQFVGCR